MIALGSFSFTSLLDVIDFVLWELDFVVPIGYSLCTWAIFFINKFLLFIHKKRKKESTDYV